MAKVFVTGLDGFTGRYLAEELIRSGHEVCGIVHKPGDSAPWRTHVCNLLDTDALVRVLSDEKPDAVVHLAAIAFVQHGDVGAIYQTNVVGTRNLLDALTRSACQPRAVLLASSANVYGNSDREVIDESTAPAPANDYAISKLTMEMVARLWEDKLPIVIARPFNYTGVGQDERFLLPKIVRHFRDRASRIELGNLDVIRDFSDVRMVVAAYRKLIEGDFAGRTFNVCSGVGYSLQDVLLIAREISGHDLNVSVNPQFVRANEVHKLVGSCQTLENAIGSTHAIPLRDTLAWMMA
ncbi:NAD-dependent epimerase/dehydratase family protein [Burkholderia pseudomultivorans]|uniref:GDP-6-deoxy-D-talose 4-dehydrogenase n=1 Tax=Burkholderia pseudomultivorans TaxID=1207504 RepID=A0ABU2EFB7_9BURK|nr:NAD-dependent epimerase/dehydratase family protein [Burkholderia pseudomultivorans]MDR8732202.1 GDP-6-deoxy-D-talose 4-dehydrogenase [Burkholderia pseudomultivorans]MDR8739107.1 GDP-6-deoxy-D-talose 4-dehydrogenase [Burkholderia pseudomultivorans]MDR8745815.1 GDP-6-deoxy-D-talose 4-dehydrogenase [Burkholderia pseudomultivorans]MDR8758223.1 GDP-6-deoxy-D-talose 4-dehydrogenase [Burkholderia pseudomultivorans]MDR8782010.1 GDP-6-deoxy-D-talose 4-dehydrogenase [Burkholderia pseudomultivorans]